MLHFDAVTDRFSVFLKQLPSEITHVFLPFGIVNPELCAKDPLGTADCNVRAIKRVLSDCFDAGLVPVFLSTDYVFDGTRGLRSEDEVQCPNTEYGRQKSSVERWLQEVKAPWLIARLSKVVSGDVDTHSVLGPWIKDVRAGNRMRTATDQIFSPALVDDIARALVELARGRHTGIYHVAGPQALSRHALNMLLVEAMRDVDPSIVASVEECTLRDIPFIERRPLDTSLSVAKMRSTLDWSFTTMADACRAIASSLGAKAARH